MRHHHPWMFYIEPDDFEQVVPKMRVWGGTGIIARIPNDRVAQAILDANVPTIALGLTDEQLLKGNPLSRLSDVSSDATQVARLAVDHLMARQLTHFAYVGIEGRAWSRRREEAFTSSLRDLGHVPHVYRPQKRQRGRKLDKELEILSAWLQTLPTPLGLFACDDERGRQVLEACRLGMLKVPEDVAVLGVDNDEVFCDLCDPPLSSIVLNAETAGYRAAELLDEMMQGRVRKTRKVLVEALHVVGRRSTGVIDARDGDVAAALKFIREKQGNGVAVNDVAAEVAIPRRRLEKRFREVLGRSVLDDIQLVRLERSKRLLLETSLPIYKVAEMSGFGSCSYFINFFEQYVGDTPRRYRLRLTT